MGRVLFLERCILQDSLLFPTHLAAKTFKPGVPRQQIRKELELWRALEHQHILRLIGIGSVDDELAALSRWRMAGTLAKVTELGVTPGQVGVWVRQIASALDYAWRVHTIVHLDLKPENVLFNEIAIRIEVSDWGISHIASARILKADESTAAAGTLPYMAPERFTGAQPTVQMDMFSLGMLVWRLACGRFPFVDNEPITAQICTGQYLLVAHRLLPEAWLHWRVWILRCLNPDFRERFVNYGALIAALPQ